MNLPTVTFYSQILWDLARGGENPLLKETILTWIKALAQLLGVTIRYTQKLHRVLSERAKHLNRSSKKAPGGAQRKNFMERKWSFEAEIDVSMDTHKENTQLKHRVKTLEVQLRDASKALRNLCGGSVSRKRTISSGGESEYSERHLRRLKRSRAASCGVSLEWLRDEGLKLLKVSALTQTGKVEEIVIDDSQAQQVETNEEDILCMMLHIKDRYNVSGGAYQEMSNLFRELPRHYKLKKKIASLNSQWNITPTPNNTVGVQQKLKDGLERRIRKLLVDSNPDSPFRRNKVVRIKLSGDGTCIGKRLHVTNFTYTILDEGDKAHGFEGNYLLAIFREPENYEFF